MLMKEISKRLNMKCKGRSCNFVRFNGEWLILISMLEMLDIWWKGFEREIIHTFIKASMESYLDQVGCDGVPQDIVSGVGYDAIKENNFRRVWFELGALSFRRPGPNLAAKGAERT